MNRTRLCQIREDLQTFRRRGDINSDELESIARALDREKHCGAGEPAWVSRRFPELRPLSIPHGSGVLRQGAAGSIVDDLEADADRWEEHLESVGEPEEQP